MGCKLQDGKNRTINEQEVTTGFEQDDGMMYRDLSATRREFDGVAEQMKGIVDVSWKCWGNNGQPASHRPCQIYAFRKPLTPLKCTLILMIVPLVLFAVCH